MLKVDTTADPEEMAAEAGLRYVNDTQPGYTRKQNGQCSTYVDGDGKLIRDEQHLLRISRLAIPPAWTNVCICPSPNGHLQATGRDARGRKQYRYHSRWREIRDATKYDRMIAFGRALPKLRKRVRHDLKIKGLPREKVLATVVGLLEKTLIRIGNDEYVRANRSYGLTTMRDHHAKISGSTATFTFNGKSHQRHEISVDDPVLAKIVKRCRELPGYELFQYVDEQGQPQKIDSTDVNQYLRETTGQEFSAKDFRTWVGTVLTLVALNELKTFNSRTQAKRNISTAIEAVARMLGNTSTICRKCYVHPAIVDAYLDGSLFQTFKQVRRTSSYPQLRREEAAVMALLRRANRDTDKG